MKETLKNYFVKYIEHYKKEYGSKPLTVYTDSLNKDIIVSEEDEEGYVEWLPELQKEKVDWIRIENIIGVDICDEFKDYLSLLSFVEIIGKFKGSYIWLNEVNATNSVEKNIKQSLSDGSYYFKDKKHFVLGGALVDDSDNYILIYNNVNNNVSIYDLEYKKEKVLSSSLKEFIKNLEV